MKISSTNDILRDQVLKPINPEALNWLNWLLTDVNTLRSWASQVFGNMVDLNDPNFLEIKNAADLAISEIESDIVKIKEFLASYNPK